MTNKRRSILIFFSVTAGTAISAGMIFLKRGSLEGDDMFLLITNLVFSLIIIAGIGYMLVWRKQ